MLTGGEDARQNAVKLFDGQILADVTVGSGAQGSVHPVFVVSNAGKNNNRQALTHLPDESDQGNAIDFRHIEIDHDDVTSIMLEPGGCLKTLGEVFAGVAFLLEIGYEKLRDCWVIIDEQEFGGIPGQYFHWWRFSIITIMNLSTNLAKLPKAPFSLRK